MLEWSIHNQRRHGDAYYIAPLAPFRGRACCKRYVLGVWDETDLRSIHFSIKSYRAG